MLYAIYESGYEFNDECHVESDPRLTHIYSSREDANSIACQLEEEQDSKYEWYERKTYEVREIEEGRIQ